MPTLGEVLAGVRESLARRQMDRPLAEVMARSQGEKPSLDFASALARPGISLIAEVKGASPSAGNLVREFDPVRLASLYAENGAAAISVLTEERFFRGSFQHLAAIRRQVLLPLLCKDFILEPYQVYEARAFGADAVLLIAAILDEVELAKLLGLARALGMEALVEVHNEEELARALKVGAKIIGINNRNLHDFRVDLETCFFLRPRIPAGIIMVSESGVEERAQVERLEEAGFHAVLVGSALVKSDDVAGKVRELAGKGLAKSPF